MSIYTTMFSYTIERRRKLNIECNCLSVCYIVVSRIRILCAVKVSRIQISRTIKVEKEILGIFPYTLGSRLTMFSLNRLWCCVTHYIFTVNSLWCCVFTS